ncbi:MAG: hypothetical protein K2G03_05555 [Bacilli bacterium]|nr:hypothetical protein [Bacilli bacterium]MDE6142050.1 hypothetical protein [Bacilli bacterium]
MDKYFQIYKDIDDTTIFRYHFPSIIDLVNYVRTAKPRRDIFPTLYSEKKDAPGKPFYGESLEDTLNHLIYGYDQTYAEYCRKSNIGEIEIAQEIDYGRVRPIKGYSGTRVDINAYLNGEDKCMLRTIRNVPKQFKTINYDLSYKSTAEESQVINRGMICMLLVNALEQNNISVNLNCFHLLNQVIDEKSGKREIIYVTINLKNVDRALNEPMCMGPFNRIEFLRRVIFRLVETTPVHPAWTISHGYLINNLDEINRLIGAGPDDITFHDIEAMGIKGKDLSTDFESVIKHLGLEDAVSLRKILK